MKKIILLFFSLLRTLGVGVHSYLASMCMALALLSPMTNAFAEEVTCSHTFAANDPHRTLCTTCKHTFFRYESKTNKEVAPNKPENLKGADGQSLGFTNTFADGHGVMEFEGPLVTIGLQAFFRGTGFTGELIIPNSVTSIGEGAFAGCSFNGNLVIPDSVTSIGDAAFNNCRGFTGSLVIPNSVTSIGEDAFSVCRGFTGSLTIGNSVTSIGDYAFYGCEGFTGSLVIPDSVTSIGDYAF
ncbi:MAG: leucine-rich repeat domain-containing protein, partial [Paludibacteraceae bacterium]|nr:leucine-rich repeat domain-containing protein [Paludibacteraceae bacterium]